MEGSFIKMKGSAEGRNEDELKAQYKVQVVQEFTHSRE